MNISLEKNTKLYISLLSFIIREEEEKIFIESKGHLRQQILRKLITEIYGCFKEKHLKHLEKFLRGRHFVQIRDDVLSMFLSIFSSRPN